MRLAAIDLDGTLVRSDGTVSERSHAALQRAMSSGIEIVLITARGPRSVGELAAELGVRGEAICSNGAIVLDLATREVIRMRTIETEVALELVHALRERFPGTRVVIFTGYATPEVMSEARRLGADAFLQKPQALSDVARVVFALLASPP